MYNLVVPLLVPRLRSTLYLTPVNVSWVQQPAQIPLNLPHCKAMIHQLLQLLRGPILLLESVGSVKQVFLFEHLPFASPGLMTSLPHPHPPNLVNSHSSHFILYILLTIDSFQQRHLRGNPTFMTILWIHILSHLRRPRFHKPTVTASQIGHGIMWAVLHQHYPVHQVRSGARPVLVHSSDVSLGARSCRVYYTMMMRKAT